MRRNTRPCWPSASSRELRKPLRVQRPPHRSAPFPTGARQRAKRRHCGWPAWARGIDMQRDTLLVRQVRDLDAGAKRQCLVGHREGFRIEALAARCAAAGELLSLPGDLTRFDRCRRFDNGRGRRPRGRNSAGCRGGLRRGDSTACGQPGQHHAPGSNFRICHGIFTGHAAARMPLQINRRSISLPGGYVKLPVRLDATRVLCRGGHPPGHAERSIRSASKSCTLTGLR